MENNNLSVRAKEIYKTRIQFMVDVNEEEITTNIEKKKMLQYTLHADIKIVCIKNESSMIYINAEDFSILVSPDYDVNDASNRKAIFKIGDSATVQDLYLKYLKVYEYARDSVIVEVCSFNSNFMQWLFNNNGKPYPYLSYELSDCQDGRLKSEIILNTELTEKFPIFTQFYNDKIECLDNTKNNFEILNNRLEEVYYFMTGNGIYLTNGEIFILKEPCEGHGYCIQQVDIDRKTGPDGPYFSTQLKPKSISVISLFENKNSVVTAIDNVDSIYYDGCTLDNNLSLINTRLSYDDISNITNLYTICEQTSNYYNGLQDIVYDAILDAKLTIVKELSSRIDTLIENKITSENTLIMSYGKTIYLKGLLSWKNSIIGALEILAHPEPDTIPNNDIEDILDSDE